MNEITPNYLSDGESGIQKFIKNVSAFIQRAKTHYKITELEELRKEMNDLIKVLEQEESKYLILLEKLRRLQYQLNAMKFDLDSKSESPVVTENISVDPSHDEMVEFLKTNYRFEHDDFDIERAIYWFSNIYHREQSSNLYSALSTSEYNPGPNERAPVYGGNAEYTYRVYDIEYDFSELNEFQKSIGVLKSIGDLGIPPGLGGNGGDSGDDLPDELIFTCLKSDIEIDKHTGLPDEDDLNRAIRQFILEETEVSPKSFQHELQHIEEVESNNFTSDAMFDMLVDQFERNKIKENMKIKINKLIEETVNEVLNEEQQKKDVSEKTRATIEKWLREHGTRKTAVKIIDSFLRSSCGLSSADLSDSSIFANGLDGMENLLTSGNFFEALEAGKETAQEMISDELGSLDENSLSEIKTWNEAVRNPHFSKLVLFEVTPPGMEDFVNSVKPHVMAKYGNNKGQKIAYALAWKQYYK